MKKVLYYSKKVSDGLLYGFIGPFSMLYIIPQFLLKITPPNVPIPNLHIIRMLGVFLIWIGALVAIWCTINMFIVGKGDPLVVSEPPKKLLTRGIFGIVRDRKSVV